MGEYYLKDRFGRIHRMMSSPKTLLDLLRLNGIPRSSVHLDGNDAKLNASVEDDQVVTFDMLRTYHLADLIRPELQRCGPRDASYLRRFYVDEPDGGCSIYETSVSSNGIRACISADFAAANRWISVIEPGKRYVVGVSGGRDSIALVSLLHHLQNDIDFEFCAVHLSATVPEKETEYVKNLCADLGLKLAVYDEQWVRSKFGMKDSLNSYLDKLQRTHGKESSIQWLHTIVCSVLEEACDANTADGIFYGLMLEDVLTSFLRRLVEGRDLIHPIKQQWGPYKYLYPMWSLSKRDIFFYTRNFLTATSDQSDATPFENGGSSRDKYYFLADAWESIVPGFGINLLLSAHEALLEQEDRRMFSSCHKCGSPFKESSMVSGTIFCTVCIQINQLEFGSDSLSVPV